MNQIIGSNGNKVHQFQHGVDGNSCRWNFQHHAERKFFCFDLSGGQRFVGFANHAAKLAQFFDGGHHREHDPDGTVGKLARGSDDRSDLCIKKFRMFERKPDASPTHKRISFFVVVSQVSHRFVTADVQRANRDVVVRRCGDNVFVDLVLFFLIGNVAVRQVQVFGSVQSDSRRAHRHGGFRVMDSVDVGLKFYLDFIFGDCRMIPVSRKFIFQVKEFSFEFSERGQRLRVRLDADHAVATVDHDGVTRFDFAEHVFDARHCRDSTRPSDNGSVTGLAACLRDDSLHVDFTQGNRL